MVMTMGPFKQRENLEPASRPGVLGMATKMGMRRQALISQTRASPSTMRAGEKQ